MLTVISGFLVGLTLIVAIGAQNVFVLRQGLRREHVGVVIVICSMSDVVLILTGVMGFGRLVDTAPWLLGAAKWGGAAFLCGYAAVAARRALDPAAEGLEVPAGSGGSAGSGDAGTTSVRSRVAPVAPVALTALALTWLNPHVYLDTFFLLGSVAATHGEARGWFALGAVAASFAWFCALGFGARYLGRWLRTARAWRLLDGAIAVVMVVLALSLVA